MVQLNYVFLPLSVIMQIPCQPTPTPPKTNHSPHQPLPRPTPPHTNPFLYNTHLYTSHAKFNGLEVLKCVDRLAMKTLHNPSTHIASLALLQCT